MPIDFDCAVCKHKVRVPDGSEGKRTKCPKCQAIQPVPGGSSLTGDYSQPQGSAPTQGDGFGTPDSDNPYADAPSSAMGGGNNPYASPASVQSFPGSSNMDRAEALEKLKVPAMVVLVLVWVGVAFNVIGLIFVVLLAVFGDDPEILAQAIGQGVGTVFSFAMQAISIIGLRGAMKLENYGMSWAGFILGGTCASGCCLIGLPFAIWGMVVLSDNGVQRQFNS